jgi:hypothetical protein
VYFLASSSAPRVLSRSLEIYFRQENYQSAANQFREALAGNIDPKWTEVWAHVNLGKTFDTTGQRDRALAPSTSSRR